MIIQQNILNKIILAIVFSILVAGATSATAWLLDPAIEKIFINKDQSLIFIIPLLIIIAFATKGISLYLAKVLMIKTAEEVKKNIQIDMLSSFIKADTEKIEDKHSGKYISNLNFDVNQITGMLSNAVLNLFKGWLNAYWLIICDVLSKLEAFSYSFNYASYSYDNCKKIRKTYY